MTTISETVVLDDLCAVLDQHPGTGVRESSWRWMVRQRLSGVRDLLLASSAPPDEDGWVAARLGVTLREQRALLTRLSALGPQVLEESDLDLVQRELARFVGDVRRHLQRVHDLVWDEVEQEFGGSE